MKRPDETMTAPGLSLVDWSWQRLYRAGAASAVLYVVLVLVPVALVFAAPVPPTDGRAVLEYIAANKVVYLTELICFVGLGAPALSCSCRRESC